MSEEKTTKKKTPKPKRYVHVFVSHEELTGKPPSGWQQATAEIPEKITGEVLVRLKDRRGELKVTIEK